MSISFAMKTPSEAYDNLSLLIKKARMSKNTYEKLCMKYNDRINVLNEQIAELDKVKKEYIKKMEAFEKQYQKMLDNLLKNKIKRMVKICLLIFNMVTSWLVIMAYM